MNLYEISRQYEQLETAIEALGSENLELQEMAKIKLQELESSLNDKAENICKLLTCWQSDNDMIDLEIKRLQGLKKTKVNSITRLKDYLKFNLDNAKIKKLDLGLFKITIRKNVGRVIIDNQEDLDKMYIVKEVVSKVDKKAIKDDLKKGIVLGCHLEITESLIIK